MATVLDVLLSSSNDLSHQSCIRPNCKSSGRRCTARPAADWSTAIGRPTGRQPKDLTISLQHQYLDVTETCMSERTFVAILEKLGTEVHSSRCTTLHIGVTLLGNPDFFSSKSSMPLSTMYRLPEQDLAMRIEWYRKCYSPDHLSYREKGVPSYPYLTLQGLHPLMHPSSVTTELYTYEAFL
jgi:hypothetical protein